MVRIKFKKVTYYFPLPTSQILSSLLAPVNKKFLTLFLFYDKKVEQRRARRKDG